MNRVVGCSNTGVDGRLTIGSMIDFMQDSSIFQLGTIDILSDYFHMYNTGIYLVSRQIDIYKMPMYGDRLTVKTGIYDRNKIYGFRNTMILDEEGNICASSSSLGAFVDIQSGKPICLPKEIVEKIPCNGAPPSESIQRKIIIPAIEPITESPVLVRKYHLDYNNHVNNAKYVSITEEFLPDRFEPKRIRVEYKMPAVYKDTMLPIIFTPDERTCIVDLRNTQGKTYAIVEFKA